MSSKLGQGKVGTYFQVDDVLNEAKSRGLMMNKTEALDFLHEYGKQITNSMTEAGWFAIDEFLMTERLRKEGKLEGVNNFINPGGYKMKHRKRNRHGRFVSNPGLFASPVTYAVGIPVLGVLGYFAFKTKLFGILKKKVVAGGPTTTPVIPGQTARVVGRRFFPTAPTTTPV